MPANIKNQSAPGGGFGPDFGIPKSKVPGRPVRTVVDETTAKVANREPTFKNKGSQNPNG